MKKIKNAYLFAAVAALLCSVSSMNAGIYNWFFGPNLNSISLLVYSSFEAQVIGDLIDRKEQRSQELGAEIAQYDDFAGHAKRQGTICKLSIAVDGIKYKVFHINNGDLFKPNDVSLHHAAIVNESTGKHIVVHGNDAYQAISNINFWKENTIIRNFLEGKEGSAKNQQQGYLSSFGSALWENKGKVSLFAAYTLLCITNFNNSK